MRTKLIGAYKNGNYSVMIFEDGTKIRKNDLDFFCPSTVESMDIKLTNRCERGCTFCLKKDAKLSSKKDSVKSISAIQAGEKVFSYDIENTKVEEQPVVQCYERDYTGILITVEDEFGHKLTCTPNHKVFTQRGYVRADELQIEDTLVVLDENKNL